MWNMAIPWWEFLARAAIVYVFLIVLLRISGKRQVGQLAPFDLVLLLVLSNAVQNSMNGGDNSVIGGLIFATVATLMFVPVVFSMVHKKQGAKAAAAPEMPHVH